MFANALYSNEGLQYAAFYYAYYSAGKFIFHETVVDFPVCILLRITDKLRK